MKLPSLGQICAVSCGCCHPAAADRSSPAGRFCVIADAVAGSRQSTPLLPPPLLTSGAAYGGTSFTDV